MFFKKKTNTPSFQENPIEFKLWYADRNIDGVTDALPLNYAEKNFEYVVWNSSNAIESLVIKCALYKRAVRNAELAVEALASIKPFVAHIEDAIAQANKIGLTETNFVHVKNLIYPFLALFLTEDWGRAERLAKDSLLPVMQEEGLEGENNNPYDEIAKLVVALVLDDRKAFEHAQARYAKDKAIDRFFNVYFNYDQLMDLIFKRDAVGFNQALVQQEALFLQRATDKKVNHEQILDGFLENNERVFDVWSVALAKLARHRGIQLNYSSDIIPLFEI